MSEQSCILHAVVLEKGAACIDLDEQQITEALESEKLAWVHLNRDHPDTREWVENKLAFLDPLIIDALFEEETRPRVEEFADGLLVNLRAANLHEGERADDMLTFRLWVDERRIVSIRSRKIFAVVDVLEKFRSGHSPESTGHFLSTLIKALIDRTEPIIADLGEQTDNIEADILDNPDFTIRRRIVSLRQNAIIFRRFMAPQRELASKLRMIGKPWLDQRCQIAFQETYDHLYRFIEDLDAIRERLQVVQDELGNNLADKLNKRMYVLSIVAAIFLPLGFLTGLLGINVAGIWGADYPSAFSVFIGILLVIVLLMALFFRVKKWF